VGESTGDDGVKWWDNFKRLHNIGKLSEIKAELDVLFQERHRIDWKKDFVLTRLMSVAVDAVKHEKDKYDGNMSFAASYMAIKGLCRDEVKDIYKKTWDMSEVNSFIRDIVHRLELENIRLSDVDFSELNRRSVVGKRAVLVYNGVYQFVGFVAGDMEVNREYLLSLLILGGSSSDRYKDVFSREFEWFKKNHLIRYRRNKGTAIGIVESFGSDTVKSDFREAMKFSSSEKTTWKVYGVDRVAREVIKKATKIEGKKIGELLSEIIMNTYGWVLYEIE